MPSWHPNAAIARWYAGRGRRRRSTSRFCPVCNEPSHRFEAHGLEPREDARCPRCGALERHRLLWIYLRERTNLFDGRAKRVLHFAPERSLASRLRSAFGRGYLSADLSDRRAMTRMEITRLALRDRSIDVVLCSHVLEHVQDDRRAMREVYRILAPGGLAILLVPITSDTTYEDPTVVEPAERLRLYGQEDHVRRYGPDYVDRLREAGFVVEVACVADLVAPDDAERMGLTAASGEIHACRR